MLVALRSSRVLITVPSRISRTISSSARPQLHQASPIDLHLAPRPGSQRPCSQHPGRARTARVSPAACWFRTDTPKRSAPRPFWSAAGSAAAPANAIPTPDRLPQRSVHAARSPSRSRMSPSVAAPGARSDTLAEARPLDRIGSARETAQVPPQKRPRSWI